MRNYPEHEAAYAASRINGSLVMLGNSIVEVDGTYSGINADDYYDRICVEYEIDREKFLGVRGSNFIVGIDHTNGTRIIAKLSDINISPPVIGYVNFGSRAKYVVRTPLRNDWRQGFRYASLMVVDQINGDEGCDVPYSAISDSVNKKFPKYFDCLQQVSTKPKIESRAWHNHWAINNKSLLLNKGRVVGIIKDGMPKLEDKYSYLQESLDEVS